jgi:hypothetical protein
MLFEIYDTLGMYGIIVSTTVLAFLTIVLPMLSKLKQYLYDGDRAFAPNWWKQVSIYATPFKWFFKDEYGLQMGVEPYGNYSDSGAPTQYTWDALGLMLVGLGGGVSWIIVFLIWPLFLLIGAVWAGLYIMRMVIRLSTRVGKLAKLSHEHPDGVALTKVEDV